MNAAEAHFQMRRRADIPQPDWTQANCRGVDPALFYPGRGESTVEAKQVCDACPIEHGCLQYALDAFERFGIWGGVAEQERRRMRTGRTVAA